MSRRTTTRIISRRAHNHARPEPARNGERQAPKDARPESLAQRFTLRTFTLRTRLRTNGRRQPTAPLITSNRNTLRLEIDATYSKQTPAAISNRNKTHSLRGPQLTTESPICQSPRTCRQSRSNRDTERLEIAASDSKQTPAAISNRNKITRSRRPRLTARAALRGENGPS